MKAVPPNERRTPRGEASTKSSLRCTAAQINQAAQHRAESFSAHQQCQERMARLARHPQYEYIARRWHYLCVTWLGTGMQTCILSAHPCMHTHAHPDTLLYTCNTHKQACKWGLTGLRWQNALRHPVKQSLPVVKLWIEAELASTKSAP